jgi:hypothetical protein
MAIPLTSDQVCRFSVTLKLDSLSEELSNFAPTVNCAVCRRICGYVPRVLVNTHKNAKSNAKLCSRCSRITPKCAWKAMVKERGVIRASHPPIDDFVSAIQNYRREQENVTNSGLDKEVLGHLKRCNCDGKLYDDATVCIIVSMIDVACADMGAVVVQRLPSVYFHILTHVEGPNFKDVLWKACRSSTYVEKHFFESAWIKINQNGDDGDDQHTTKLYATIRLWQLLRNHDKVVSAAQSFDDSIQMHNEWKKDCYGSDNDGSDDGEGDDGGGDDGEGDDGEDV